MVLRKSVQQPAIRPELILINILFRFHRFSSYSYVHSKISKFKPNLNLFFENSRYIVKTAENGEELKKVLQLRYQVFYQEVLDKTNALQLDVDKYDFICDHLIIIDKASNETVGTYRFNCSRFSNEFYSSKEFNIRRILAMDGHKLEVGRACVHEKFRNSAVIVLLWKGIREYIVATGARYLFGCSSIQTMELDRISAVWHYFHENGFTNTTFNVVPRNKYRIKNLEQAIRRNRQDYEEVSQNLIPPLLKFYLKAGACVCGRPVIDRAFKCADFFTLFDTSNLTKQIEKKFGKCSA